MHAHRPLRLRLSHLLLGLGTAVLASAATAGAASRADYDSAFITRLSSSVVKITANGPGNKLFSGSGVVVGPNEVLTNCHVTRNSERVSAVKGALRYPAVAQRADMARDLCLLTTYEMILPPVEVRSATTMATGDTVFFYGYPGGADAFFTDGRVGSLHPFAGSSVIETSAGFGLGASGGGLFDAEGRLVGIATFLSAGHSGHYFAMPADWLTELRKQPAQELQPMPGMALWELPTGQQPTFLQMQRMVQEKRWLEALDLATRWVMEEPKNFDAWLSQGRAFSRTGQAAKAVEPLQRAIELAPGDANVIRELGSALAAVGDKQASEALFARLAPEDRDCELAC